MLQSKIRKPQNGFMYLYKCKRRVLNIQRKKIMGQVSVHKTQQETCSIRESQWDTENMEQSYLKCVQELPKQKQSFRKTQINLKSCSLSRKNSCRKVHHLPQMKLSRRQLVKSRKDTILTRDYLSPRIIQIGKSADRIFKSSPSIPVNTNPQKLPFHNNKVANYIQKKKIIAGGSPQRYQRKGDLTQLFLRRSSDKKHHNFSSMLQLRNERLGHKSKKKF